MSRLGRGFPNNALMRIPVTIPVAYDAVGSGATHGGTGTFTASHTLGSGATAIVVPVSIFSGAGAPTVTVNIGTATAPLLGTTANFGGSYYGAVSLFGLIMPPTGAQTISVTVSGGSVDYLALSSVSYMNAANFGPVGTSTGSGASATQTVTSAPKQMVAQAFGTVTSSGGASFTGYNQTQRANIAAVSAANEPLVIGDAPGAGSVTFSATSPGAGSYNWGGIAVPLIPV